MFSCDEDFLVVCHAIAVLVIALFPLFLLFCSIRPRVFVLRPLSSSQNPILSWHLFQVLIRVSTRLSVLLTLGRLLQVEVSPWESIRLLISAMVGRQVMVTTALRKVSASAYGSLIARKPNLLNQVPLRYHSSH
jgi:hypothetical protein